jgi:hypothetical protein
MYDEQEYGTMVTMEGIMLTHEKTCADIATNPANYPAGNKTALSGTDVWSDYANSDPIAQIKDYKSAVRSRIAKYPNTLLLGATAFEALQNHPKVVERIKYSQLGVVTVDLLSALLNIENVVVGNGVYSSDGDTFADIWADVAILAYVPRDPRTPYEPSYGYTLRKRNMPETDVYDENGGKVQMVRTTDNWQVKMVGPDAGYLVTNIVA